MSTLIAVTGRAEERIAPELGAVSVAVAASTPEPERAMRLVSESHARLIAQLRALESAGALERWTSSQIRAWSHRPWNADGRRLPPVFDARTELEVVFRDLGRLTEWVSEAGIDELVAIQGVDWRLTDGTRRRIREQAQRHAIDDAVAKAAVYAEALGLSRPVPVELADSGLLAVQGGSPQQVGFARKMSAFGAEATPAPELAPAELVVEASVDARFAADPI